ncbi:MAG: 7,8-didemethyl-8-hydroxy-5-deazariboflavin synthase subunit CofG [Methanobrevibacter sp.]|uniref:7,8-didemethyl-8-hydroxy-5-deazariboflavin synthase subunit CofG n=1 Tax=uncultured Methanobrevibacter sp. TaxID=253161 RepID=UPI0025E2FA85|nr:7,8-didemethyl-8-hydroxy-5-deazariboflavin synthase subunit CofG [uncultured Methanobrevibacter sp.]MEE1129820.1 7,8-didemethyl-8-hydroxy-5-deazariboflavin synthase subunit CofG [Methanobrevibacter sp.]
MSNLTKEEILTILNAKDSDILKYMSKTAEYRENNLITYSKNIFIPLTEICRNDCGYCNFKKNPDDPNAIILKTKDEILAELKEAEKYGCKEALFTFGEDADDEEIVQMKLNEFGYNNMCDYIYDICEMTLNETSLLPHTNGGNFTFENLKKLKEVNASMGLMLENSSNRLMELPAHKKSPGKNPQLRIETISNAGKLKIPYTTGILIGIGETKEEIAESLLTIKDIYDEYGHIQEVIIQNFTPIPGIEMENWPEPSFLDMIRTVIAGSLLFKDTDVSIQVPPNLNNDTAQIFLLCGADDWGGVSPVSPDYVNITSPWPGIDELEKLTIDTGFELTERLCVYEKYINAEWLNELLLEKISNLS